MTAQSPALALAPALEGNRAIQGQANIDAPLITLAMAPFPSTVSVRTTVVTEIQLFFGVRGGLLCL